MASFVCHLKTGCDAVFKVDEYVRKKGTLRMLTVCPPTPAGLPGDSRGLGFKLQQLGGHSLGDHCPAGQRQHPQPRP